MAGRPLLFSEAYTPVVVGENRLTKIGEFEVSVTVDESKYLNYKIVRTVNGTAAITKINKLLISGLRKELIYTGEAFYASDFFVGVKTSDHPTGVSYSGYTYSPDHYNFEFVILDGDCANAGKYAVKLRTKPPIPSMRTSRI